MNEQVRDVRNHIARDVQATATSANAAYQRINVTTQWLKQANVALDLGEANLLLSVDTFGSFGVNECFLARSRRHSLEVVPIKLGAEGEHADSSHRLM